LIQPDWPKKKAEKGRVTANYAECANAKDLTTMARAEREAENTWSEKGAIIQKAKPRHVKQHVRFGQVIFVVRVSDFDNLVLSQEKSAGAAVFEKPK
jgi:hypothetical protein